MMKERTALTREWEEVLSDRWNIIGYLVMMFVGTVALYMAIHS